PGFPEPGVAGHKGELVAGKLEGVPVIVQAGRFHLYEGHPAGVAGLPARVLAQLGVEILSVTNAAGGVRRTFPGGTLMLIADHINLMWRNPLIGQQQPGEQRFPIMHAPYDGELRALARTVAREMAIRLEEGVYVGLLGPSYETPAEVRMLERLGADAVGMSTVPEVLVARSRFPFTSAAGRICRRRFSCSSHWRVVMRRSSRSTRHLPRLQIPSNCAQCASPAARLSASTARSMKHSGKRRSGSRALRSGIPRKVPCRRKVPWCTSRMTTPRCTSVRGCTTHIPIQSLHV